MGVVGEMGRRGGESRGALVGPLPENRKRAGGGQGQSQGGETLHGTGWQRGSTEGWDGCREVPKHGGWKHLEYKEGINFGQKVAPSILTGGKAKAMLCIGKSLGVVIES